MGGYPRLYTTPVLGRVWYILPNYYVTPDRLRRI